MATVWTDEARAARELHWQQKFRDRYVAATPSWYRGEYHLAATLVLPVFTLVFSWLRLTNVTPWEWLLFVPIFLFGNWCEWAGHRYMMHGRIRGLEMIYKRHCGTHHQFFTNHDLSYKGQKQWRALVFPPFAPLMFLLAALPFALIIGFVWSKNAGYVVMFAMAAYYLMYEGLHTLSHLSDEKHPWLKHIPLVNTVRRMHVTHHDLGFMQTRNFNLTFPLCDWLFGTSDIDRGLIGTLFNGTNDRYRRKFDARPELLPDIGERAEETRG